MHEQARILVETVMDMISGTLDNYEQDPHHAPAAWLLENWWCTLNAALQVVPGTTGEDLQYFSENRDEKRKSEIGNHTQSKAYSFKPADKTESEKGHQDVKSDE